MGRISQWFDCHVKTRIALQLMLDGLPVLLALFPLVVGVLELEEILMYPGWWDTIAMGCTYILLFGGGAVIFGIAVWLRSKATDAFEHYPCCKAVSTILRILSLIPAVLSFGCLIGITVSRFRTQ